MSTVPIHPDEYSEEAEQQLRNEFGLPPISVSAQGPITSKIDQRDDHSVNKPLPWIVLAAVLGAIGLGLGVANMPRQSDMSTQLASQVGAMTARLTDQQNAYEARLQDLIRAAADKEQEMRMLEYYVMENDGKLVDRGVIKPEETWSARKLQRKPKEK